MEGASRPKLVKSKSSNSAVTMSNKPKSKQLSTSNVINKVETKKRGVYVEKWGNPNDFQIQESKGQPRAPPQPTNVTAETISTSNGASRYSSIPDSTQTKQHKPLKKTTSPTAKISKQRSPTSNNVSSKKQPKDAKPQRNIIEENKKQVQTMKYRSKALSQIKAKNSEKVITFKSRKDIIQTPSNASKLTREMSMSDHAHWSKIFPSDPQSSAGKNVLKEYIDSFEQNGKNEDKKPSLDIKKPSIVNKKPSLDSKKVDDSTAEDNGKDGHIYNYFIDLLDTVYDEMQDKDLDNNGIAIVRSGDSSKIKFEIEENVAKKLYMEEDGEELEDATQIQSNRYTVKDDGALFDQSRKLAKYYNKRTQNRTRLPKKIKNNNRFTYTSTDFYKIEENKKKPKKQNLLNLLKLQLMTNYDSYEEPESMYDALHTIAKNKRQHKQIYFENFVKEPKSDFHSVCRFKRRKVISPSTKSPRHNNVPKSVNTINTSKGRHLSGSLSNDNESDHSLEVFGFDYNENGNIFERVLPGMEGLDERVLKRNRGLTKINNGITTISQYWR